jgi:glycosyltransferase involved in cell wall biosynthesis
LSGVRVGLDYHPAVTHAPGAGRYARELVRALVRLDDAPELRLLEVGGERASIGEPALGLADAPRSPRRRRLRVPRRWIARLGIGADRLLGGVDLFHRVHPDWPPVSRAVEVQPVAELGPPGGEGDAALSARFVRGAHAVVFSAGGAELVAERFGLPSARVHRTPVGCEHWARVLPEPGPRDEEPAYAVVLGSVRRDRRHVAIARAFESLWRRQVIGRLFVLGGRGDAADAFEEVLLGLEARDQVRWIERPREGQHPPLVASAAVLVHLASNELTPVTPLEGLSFGTPVVASRIPAFEEALGGEARLVEESEADDPEALAAAIEAAAESARDPEAEARRRAVAARFSWAGCAEATLAAWRAILGQ